MKKEINFSDLIDFFGKNQIPTFDEEIDKYGGYFITAARIAAVIIAPDPVSKISVFCAGIDAASLRASKLFNWLPDKFKYKDREKFAIKRYELSAYVNYILLQIAIKNGVKEVIMPYLEVVMANIELDEEVKDEIKLRSEESDKERLVLSLPTNCTLSKNDISQQAFKVIEPIFSGLSKHIDKFKESKPALKKLDTTKIKETFLENVTIYYQAFLINFSGEFPEFALWADITQKDRIIKELKTTAKSLHSQNRKTHERFSKQMEVFLEKIKELKDNSFIKESGFPSFLKTYEKMFKMHTEHLSTVLNGKILENIKAHQQHILKGLNHPLSQNTDVDEIIYPLNKDIFISQSFEAITYKKNEHRRVFLTKKKLSEQTSNVEAGENIGNYLLKNLVDPNYANKPIILLGNPGAGKSMLSKMFAGLLCQTTDFIPFLIQLRNVSSSSGSISEHINKGLANTIANLSEVNWIDWAKEFRTRIPIIIMDGFDELMQTSNRELNGYVDAIREFQEQALNSGICVRIILTSRISVMQDVFIPENTKIIKLDSFDTKRRNLWIQKWNDAQKKPKYKFAIPKNDKIELLAEEPLLLFMLAIYDFESNELQSMATDKTFNQSKLYDSLLKRFIERQLEKLPHFIDLSEFERSREKELFRLRLGMIALMMFLTDTTSRDTQKLSEEILAFGINKSNMPTGNILGGFFFIHENQSKTEGNLEKFNYEFLHKTFGEFLTADFLLRVAKKQYERVINNAQDIIARKETFNFCFGYNWLHKHNNIQNFLFEHARHIIDPESLESKFTINSIIKADIKELFEKGHQSFPVTDIRLLEKKPVIEHLSIYSQNIIFLWLAIASESNPVKFEIFDASEDTGEPANEPKYESQDRDETNKNKLLWKRLAKLWTLVGNYSATAKLAEWVSVKEKGNHSIELEKVKSEIIHNFSNSASVGCNDFELLLSFFDNENKFPSKQSTLTRISDIIIKKPELSPLAIDVVLHRFHDLYSSEGFYLVEWFSQLPHDLNQKQQISFMKKISMLRGQVEPLKLAEVIRHITEKMPSIFRENLQASSELLKMLIDLKPYMPFYQIFDPDIMSESLRRFSREFGRYDKSNPLIILEYIRLFNELNKTYPFRRKFRMDFLEESVHHLTKDMRHFVREHPYFAFEYLSLLNELRKYYPIRKLHPEFFDEIVQVLSRDAKHIIRSNPHTILEYLKLLSDLKEHLPIGHRISREFVIESLKYITEEWEAVFRDNHFNLLAYLKILSEFKTEFSMSDIPRELLREAFYRLSKDLVYIVRDSPKEAQAYLTILKTYYSNFRTTREFNQGPFFPITREMEMDIEVLGNPQALLIYLELILLSRDYYIEEDRSSYILEKIVDMLLSQPNQYPHYVIMRAAALLNEYNISLEVIERLLRYFPRIHHLLSSSPELAKQVLEAASELNNHERFS